MSPRGVAIGLTVAALALLAWLWAVPPPGGRVDGRVVVGVALAAAAIGVVLLERREGEP